MEWLNILAPSAFHNGGSGEVMDENMNLQVTIADLERELGEARETLRNTDCLAGEGNGLLGDGTTCQRSRDPSCLNHWAQRTVKERDEAQAQLREAQKAVEKGGVVMFTGLSVPKRELDAAKAEHAGRVADLRAQLRSSEAAHEGMRAALEWLAEEIHSETDEGKCLGEHWGLERDGCKSPLCKRLVAALSSPSTGLQDAGQQIYEALIRTGKWSPTVGGYLVCMVCCNGMRCECERGEHIPREDCPNCLGKSGSIFAPSTGMYEALYKALKECQRLAIERIETADAAVKKDVYAADALMGIATIARAAIKDYEGGCA